MKLEHVTTRFYFEDKSNSDDWEVVYQNHGQSLTVDVMCNRLLIHKFKSIPSEVKRVAKHPTKTQAMAIVKLAKKLND